MNLRRLLFCLCLFIPATALAHAELEASSVEDGATITEPLAEVSLTFTEAAELGFSTFKVYPLPADAAVAAVPEGAAGADDHDESAGDQDDAARAEDEHAAEAADDHGDEGDKGGHAALDAAAETLMAEVIDAPDDADARADAGVTPATGQSETVTLRLKDGLEPGAYAVMWNVLSVDAHTIEGFLTFTYDSGN